MKSKKISLREKEFLSRLTDEVTKARRVHKMWTEFQRLKKLNSAIFSESYFGKWQYIYSNSYGQTSLIRLRNDIRPFKRNKWFWECYSDDKFFTDTARFKNLKEAEKFILAKMNAKRTL